QGIYPVLLYFRDKQQLLLCYGVSETNEPQLGWGALKAETVRDWFTRGFGQRPDRYGTSYVWAAYDVSQPLPIEDIQRELGKLIDRYEQVLQGSASGV